MKISFNIKNEAELLTIVDKLKPILNFSNNKVIKIFLHGNLGAGKSTFFRYFLRNLNYQEPIPSPTYSIIESYSINKYKIHHLDLYRISSFDDLYFIGWNDLQEVNNILFIEWPSKGDLDISDIDIYLKIVNESERDINIIINNKAIINLFK